MKVSLAPEVERNQELAVSVFDLFRIGIGPSSSHTVGPMRAARSFIESVSNQGLLDSVATITIDLYGSLAMTGRAHGTDKAILLGLEGEQPETVEVPTIEPRIAEIHKNRHLTLLGGHSIDFDQSKSMILHRHESLSLHPNGMMLSAIDREGDSFYSSTYFSVGGGFVIDQSGIPLEPAKPSTKLPYEFSTGSELLSHCSNTGLAISDVMLANELVWRTEDEIRHGLYAIWSVMQECIDRGCTTDGTLPGFLKVRRRAPDARRRLTANDHADPLSTIDWIDVFALAVSEENAAGGRVVTAPTNGAAGIIPAVLLYYVKMVPNVKQDSVIRFLLTAAAIGILCKKNASISGAEVGCQGEVGSACAMAAGALCEGLGGTPSQVENAAEIGIEHNLGLTCDPVGGLVQIPCIERNAMGAIKAVNAARIALAGNGDHVVSLDKALLTMRRTGADMKTKYKETSRGGLALNFPEC